MAAAETVLRAAWSGGVVIGGVTVVEVAVDPGEPVSPFVWRAEKLADGRIILSGHVPSRMIASQIEAEATRLSRGQSPENHMEVAAGAPGGNWQGVARFGLGLLTELDSGEVRLSDNTLRVGGTELDPAERARLSAQVSALAAPYRGVPLFKGLITDLFPGLDAPRVGYRARRGRCTAGLLQRSRSPRDRGPFGGARSRGQRRTRPPCDEPP